MAGDGVERRGVPRGVLPEVEPDEREPERRGAPQHVGQPPVGDDASAPVSMSDR